MRVAASQTHTVTVHDPAAHRMHRPTAPPPSPAPPAPTRPPPVETPPDAAPSERDRIIDALVRAGGNQTEAARLLGMSRRTLINRVIQFQIPRPRKK